MEITGTRSYINVKFTDGEFSGKKVKIYGELTLTPAFYADKKSIKYWEAPHESIEMLDSEKQDIVEQVLKQKNSHFEIFFKD